MPTSDRNRALRPESPGARGRAVWGGRIPAPAGPVARSSARRVGVRPRHRVQNALRFAWVAALVALIQLGCSPPPRDLPPLSESLPSDREKSFPISGWIILDFSEAVQERAIERIELSCAGVPQAMRVHRVTPTRLAVDPIGEFGPASRCKLEWSQSDGTEHIRFKTGMPNPPAQIPYDREDHRQVAPYPDDYWLAANPADPSEQKLRVQMSGFSRSLRWLMNALASGVREFDGFSPLAHITIPLSVPADPDSIPLTPEQSLDPLASIGLFDITPGSPDYASRIPFRTDARADAGPKRDNHALLLFPSVVLKSRHRYGVVVTRRARSRAGSPYDPSAFFATVRDGSNGLEESWAVKRARTRADDVLAAIDTGPVAIERVDVAFAARFTVRSFDGIADDLSAIRRMTAAAPAPAIEITRVESGPSRTSPDDPVAAIVRGTWTAPDWRDADGWLARDSASGTPVQTGLETVPFTLALPRAAYRGPVPVVMYQHGNPGSASDEVVDRARESLAAAGFAVIGFTDRTNREGSPLGSSMEDRARWQVIQLLVSLIEGSKFPDDFVVTVFEQLAFLRAIQAVAEIPSFAVDAPVAAARVTTPGIDARARADLRGSTESTPASRSRISESARAPISDRCCSHLHPRSARPRWFHPGGASARSCSTRVRSNCARHSSSSASVDSRRPTRGSHSR